LEQVSFDASPPPGWMWFVQGYWGDDYLTENERERLFLWQHAGPDHVRIIPVRHHVSPSIVRTYAFARWCGGLNGGSLTARLMEKDATFRDEVKHIRSIVSGRDLPRVRQDAAPPPGLDWYVLEGTREDDRPKLWKRGCDATGAIDALRVMPDPPRQGSA